MIVYVAHKNNVVRYEGSVPSALGVFHTRNQAIEACRADAAGLSITSETAESDDWALSVDVDVDEYNVYTLSRHKVPKAVFSE